MKTRVVKFWHAKALRFVYGVEQFDPDFNCFEQWPEWGEPHHPFDTQAEAEAAARRLAGLCNEPENPRIVVIREFGGANREESPSPVCTCDDAPTCELHKPGA